MKARAMPTISFRVPPWVRKRIRREHLDPRALILAALEKEADVPRARARVREPEGGTPAYIEVEP